MKTAMVEPGASASTTGGWRLDLRSGAMLAVVVIAGIEGVAFATWASADRAIWIFAVALLAIVSVGSVIAIVAPLAAGPVDDGREWSEGRQWPGLILAAVCGAGIVGNAVLIPATLQADLVENPHSGPTTLASLEGQRALLLNGFSIRFYLVLLVAFVGLLVRRRRST